MWFVNLLFNIWTYLPFLAITDELVFSASEKETEKPHKYYLSLINILFGEKRIQFVSAPILQPNKKVIIFRVIQFSQMDRFKISGDKVKQLENDYKQHYDTLSENDKTIEKEELLRHLEEQESRIETSFNKINAFTTIIVAVIPILITLFDWSKLGNINTVNKIVFAVLIYANINLCAWVFQANNVRGIEKSAFRDLKNSKEKSKEQNWQIYFDWQQIMKKADMYVSFVMYIKTWVLIVIFVSIIFFAVVQNIRKTDNESMNDRVYTVETNLIEKTYDESAIRWNRLLAELQENEYKRVLVLYNDTDIIDIRGKLEKFRCQKFVWITDNGLKEKEMKIILEE